jgi:hypothetical protein
MRIPLDRDQLSHAGNSLRHSNQAGERRGLIEYRNVTARPQRSNQISLSLAGTLIEDLAIQHFLRRSLARHALRQHHDVESKGAFHYRTDFTQLV